MAMKEARELRDIFCEVLMQEAERDTRVCLLEADLMLAAGTYPFNSKFPDRTFNVGVCEANMMSVAAGLAAMGKIPVATTFTPFASRRVYDQVFLSICYAGLNVKIRGLDPGIAAQLNGGTHMCFEDVGLMRNIPNMTVVEPIDEIQMRRMLPEIIRHDGPVYFRTFRMNADKIYNDDYEFVWGKPDRLCDGCDVTIMASGILVQNALDAAALLRAEGISARVYNVHTIKPLHTETVLAAATETGAVVTVENHNVVNGLGSAVAEVLVENAPVPMERVGIRDCFGEVGKLDYLQKRFSLEASDIAAAARRVVGRKKNAGPAGTQK